MAKYTVLKPIVYAADKRLEVGAVIDPAEHGLGGDVKGLIADGALALVGGKTAERKKPSASHVKRAGGRGSPRNPAAERK